MAVEDSQFSQVSEWVANQLVLKNFRKNLIDRYLILALVATSDIWQKGYKYHFPPSNCSKK